MFNNEYIPLLFLQVNILNRQTRLLDSLCDILFILGIIGNVLGLFIFSLCQRSWRISSIYAYLATYSSIANIFCIIRYAFILHSLPRQILSRYVGRIWWACKIYEFSFSCRVISSWITLFWMFERLICISTRLQTFFHRWNSFKLKFIIPIFILMIILGCVIVPPVYMFQPQIFQNRSLNSIAYCGLNPNVSVKWKNYFNEVHFGANHSTIRCLFSELIPAGAIIIFDVCIVFHLAHTCQRLHKIRGQKVHKNQLRTASWMNIILILHSLLFLSSLFSHIIGHVMRVEAHETWWVSLAILVNCSLNFYVYCLSGKAFRNEIRRLIQQLLKNDKVLINRRKHLIYKPCNA